MTDLEEKLYTAATDRGSLDHEILNLKDLLATKKSEMDRDARTREKLEIQLKTVMDASSKKDLEYNIKVNEIKQVRDQLLKLEAIVRDERQKFEKSEEKMNQSRLAWPGFSKSTTNKCLQLPH